MNMDETETASLALDPVSLARQKLELLQGHRKQAGIELAAGGPDAPELMQEIRQLDSAIRELNVEIFRLQKKIKRAPKKRECKCPTCDRFIGRDVLLSEALIEKLRAAGFGGLVDNL